MICTDCGKEKVIERVNEIIYERPICSDCVDEDLNLKLAKEMEERFEFGKKHGLYK